jgi:hypothetical protein
MKLDDSSKVNFKTFLKASKVYNVTHVVALQHAKNSMIFFIPENFLRIVKLGGGEMTFRIINYCCMRDVLHNGGQPFSLSFKDPLTVLNGFGGNSQTKMIGRALQEMFPPINP